MKSVLLLCALCALACGGASPQAGDRMRVRDAAWKRDGRNLLAGFGNMYNLRVLRVPDRAYPYRGWFFGWAVEDCNRHIPGFKGCDAIFAARARNLAGPWEVWAGGTEWASGSEPARWRPVFAPTGAIWDSWHNGDPSVVLHEGKYYMAYSATGNNRDGKAYGEAGDTDGSLLCVMGAVSKDGLRWRRSPEPILLNKQDLGARTVSGGDVHMHGSYHRPSLLRENGVWRLWFDYWTERGIAMGYAENRGDFLNPADWRVLRSGSRPVEWEFPNPNVVRAGEALFAFSDAGGYLNHVWTGRKITEMVSFDGFRWLALGHLEPDSDAPAIHVPEALVERAGGGWRIALFYACQIGGDPYDYRYNRIRKMERTVTRSEIARLKAEWRRAFASPAPRQ